MTITYNAAERAFEFRDNLALRYRLLYLIMIILAVSSGISLYRALPTGIGWSQALDIFVVVASCLVLTIPSWKTGRMNVSVEEIKGLEVKTVFGNERYSLRLKNGKLRNVLNVDSQVEANRLRRLMAEAGID